MPDKKRPVPKTLTISVRNKVVELVQNQRTDNEGKAALCRHLLMNILPTPDAIGRILDLSFSSVVYRIAGAIRSPDRVGKRQNGFTDIEISKRVRV